MSSFKKAVYAQQPFLFLRKLENMLIEIFFFLFILLCLGE